MHVVVGYTYKGCSNSERKEKVRFLLLQRISSSYDLTLEPLKECLNLLLLYQILFTVVTVETCRHDIILHEFGQLAKGIRTNGHRNAGSSASVF